MPLAFINNHHHHHNNNKSLAEINPPSKPTRSLSRKNLFGFGHQNTKEPVPNQIPHNHNQERQNSQNQDDRPPQLPQRNLRSSVFLLNGVLQSSELDFTSNDDHQIVKSVDRPNRLTTRPASWILMQDGLYAPPQKHSSSASSSNQDHHDESQTDLYDDETLLSDSNHHSISKTSFISDQNNQIKSESNPTDHHKNNTSTLAPPSSYTVSKPLSIYSNQSQPSLQSNSHSTQSSSSINSTSKSNSSYSPLAAFLGTPIKSPSSKLTPSSSSSTNLKPSSSNSLLATFFNSGNQSSSSEKIDRQTDSPESGLIDQTKLNIIDDQPSKPQSNPQNSSKDNLINVIKTPSREINVPLDPPLVQLPKNGQSRQEQEPRIKVSNTTIQRSQSNALDEAKHISAHQQVTRSKSTDERVNQSINLSINKMDKPLPHSLITPPMTPMKQSEPIKRVEPTNPSINNQSLGPNLNPMTRQTSTGQSSMGQSASDEFQSVKSLPISESQHYSPAVPMHSKSQENMNRPVTLVYTEEYTEEIYSSEQDGRCSTLSSPSTDTNSARSENFPMTPNSERIRPESDPSSKPDQLSTMPSNEAEEEKETKEVEPIKPPKLEDVLFTSPNRILKRILSNLTYLDFFNLSLVSTNLRDGFGSDPQRTEVILERYLGSLGYRRRAYSQKMTESISLKDLQAFYTGLEFGNEEIGKIAREMIRKGGRGIERSTVKMIREACRSWNRILIHIRENVQSGNGGRIRNGSVVHLGNSIDSVWKLGRAAVLRVWVPTRESWMSNEELVECERELWRSQVWPWLKKGDVCWNTGLGEFANEGKLIFDGKYLRDLAFEFDSIGHLPSWLNMMSFPPVYYHRIIESSTPSPIFYLDLSSFGKEVQSTMKLCKDQIEMSSPMTRYRVQRWVYRAIIEIRPGMMLFGKKEMVDLGWCGRVVVEVEGTSECARELLKRCSKEWSVEIDQRNRSASSGGTSIHLTPWRIIREKCGPGKMWIRPVLDDEKI